MRTGIFAGGRMELKIVGECGIINLYKYITITPEIPKYFKIMINMNNKQSSENQLKLRKPSKIHFSYILDTFIRLLDTKTSQIRFSYENSKAFDGVRLAFICLTVYPGKVFWRSSKPQYFVLPLLIKCLLRWCKARNNNSYNDCHKM